jgi:hypothetical protein
LPQHGGVIPINPLTGEFVASKGCSRWYLKPMAGMCHDYQWVIVFAEPVGIVVKASSDKKLHIGLKERILNPF